MSTPITAKRFTELCDLWGIKWIPIHDNWYNHNRAGHGEWGPVNGIVIHHTGSDGKVSDQESILWNGYGDLPGPICHSGIDPAGILRLAGWGRVNHAGLGSSTTLAHVIAEDYKGVLHPGTANTDGNMHFYGFETMYSGSHPMSDAQRKTAVRVAAMLCTEHKWHAESAIGHGEWQQGKWDPGIRSGVMMDMAAFRNEVRQAILEGPPKKTTPPPVNKPPVNKPPVVNPHPADSYIVAHGDTLSGIARKFNTTVEKLIDLNPSLIQPGIKLKVR